MWELSASLALLLCCPLQDGQAVMQCPLLLHHPWYPQLSWDASASETVWATVCIKDVKWNKVVLCGITATTAVYPLQRSFCHFSRRGHLNLQGILTSFYFPQPQESSPVSAHPPDFLHSRLHIWPKLFFVHCSSMNLPDGSSLGAWHWHIFPSSSILFN